MSSTPKGGAIFASVDFLAASDVPLAVGGTSVVDGRTTAAIADVGGGVGLLTYDPEQCSSITLASGVVLAGIQMIWPGEDPAAPTASTIITAAQFESVHFRPLELRSAGPLPASLLEESLLTTIADNRISTTLAETVVIGPSVYVHWRSVAGVRRWLAPDWGRMIVTPGDWAGAPTTLLISDAISRLAAANPGA